MKNKRLFIAFIVGDIIIAAILLVFIIGQNKKSLIIINSPEPENLNVSNSNNSRSGAAEKTYTHENPNFSINYPSDWQLTANTLGNDYYFDVQIAKNTEANFPLCGLSITNLPRGYEEEIVTITTEPIIISGKDYHHDSFYFPPDKTSAVNIIYINDPMGDTTKDYNIFYSTWSNTDCSNEIIKIISSMKIAW